MRLVKAPDIKKRLKSIIASNGFGHIPASRVFAFRSFGSKARARARIWAFPKIWQLALDLKPAYIIEVISEKYDYLSQNDRDRVLVHELTHIPKNFSGSLLPHLRRLFRNL